jgi:hypothetical protein
MLEQEWCFLASHTPYDAFMEKYSSFESAEKACDFFHPIEECKWKLHLVTLPRSPYVSSKAFSSSHPSFLPLVMLAMITLTRGFDNISLSKPRHRSNTPRMKGGRRCCMN